MRRILKLFLYIFSILLIVISQSSANDVPWQEIKASDLQNNKAFGLNEGWLYMPGDNTDWKLNVIDESNWERLDSTSLPICRMPRSGWDGIGWFRLHLDVDSTLLGQTVLLLHSQAGAAEVYLNGKLVQSIGKVGATLKDEAIYRHYLPEAFPLKLDNRPEQLLAVRYSNIDFLENGMKHQSSGFIFALADIKEGINVVNSRKMFVRSKQMFTTGVLLSLFLLHLALYVFYPKQKANLFYAFFILSTTLLIATIYYDGPMVRGPNFVIRDDIFLVSMVVTLLFCLKFIYTIIEYKTMPPQMYIMLAVGAVLVFTTRTFPIHVYYLFTVISLMEGLRALLRAIRYDKKEVAIILMGMSVFTFCVILQVVASSVGISIILHKHPFLFGTLFLLGTMSIYLARSVSSTNRDLESRIAEVDELTERAIETERKIQQQEMSRVLLEAEIERKKQELHEERKMRTVLSELRDANSQLKQTQSQLVQSEKMAALGSLVAGIAHEINTPVGAVHSMRATLFLAINKLTNYFKDKYPDEFVDNKAVTGPLRIINDADKVMDSGTKRVANIVRRLKSFARLDEAEMMEANIHEGIEDTLMLIHHELKHGINVTRDYGDIPNLYCYPGKLNQVFLNLLVNAEQAMGGKGDIIIKTWQEDKNIKISITDNGCGIPEEKLPRIFDPGFTTKGVGIGTGLGLSICYNIIQDHQGMINVASEVDVGTTFTISIPVDLEKRMHEAENKKAESKESAEVINEEQSDF